MARETLKDFLRSERYPRPNENSEGMIQYSLQDPTSVTSDLNIDSHTGSPLLDLETEGSEDGLVGNFLHYISKQSGDFYEFNKGNQKTFAGERGRPLIEPDTFIADEPFIPQGTIEDSLLGSYSNSRYFDDSSTEGVDELERGIISKIDGAPRPVIETPGPLGTITAPGARGANNLLGGVRDNGEEDFLVRATVNSFKKNSRFNMDEVFLEEGSSKIPQLDEGENYQFVKEEEDFYTSFEKLKNAEDSTLSLPILSANAICGALDGFCFITVISPSTKFLP